MPTSIQASYPGSNSSYFLNNYELGGSDIGLCLISGLTCIPYAERHWALSKVNSDYSSWHKVIAILEYLPLIGGPVALVERVIAFASSFFSLRPGSTSTEAISTAQAAHRPGNASASEFISCINPTLSTHITPLTAMEAQEFLSRGGSLNIITPQKVGINPITISKAEQVITGCTAGINRSQVAAAVIAQMGISVKGVLAGGDSAMNPEADFPSILNPLEYAEDPYQAATNFAGCFGMPKRAQIGVTQDEVGMNATFYQHYINQLAPTHFVTFGLSGPSVIRRLLQRQGRLKGFTITHCPWGDTINHPPENSGLSPYSTGAYNRFAEGLRRCFRTA